MRVVFVHSATGWTASARVFLLAARGLQARGHQVSFACPAESPAAARVADSQLPVLALGANASRAGDTWTLRGVLRNDAVDAVFVHGDAELLLATTASRLAGRRVLVVRRVPPFDAAAGRPRSRLARRMAATRTLYSTAADREAAGAAGAAGAEAGVAPLGVDAQDNDRVAPVDAAALDAPVGAELVVCVHDGRSNPRVFAAMRTVALLAPRHPELHLVITGAGRLDELQMEGAALGMNARVTYVGDRRDERAILRAAHVGWLCADGDAAALAALDLMSYGRPIIAARTPLTEHYVADGSAGMLLPRGDATTTAATLAPLFSKPELREQMGAAGRVRLARQFPYEATVQGFERVMDPSAAPLPAALDVQTAR